MDNLSYSTDAINILDQFYEVDKILYVEGIDDKVFWEILFHKFYRKKIEILDVGGIENLTPYINGIENELISNSYVACDQDYNFFINKTWSSKIICTYGHSIENSIFLKENVCDVIRSFSKHSDRVEIAQRFEQWIDDFIKKITPLVYCDIFNEKYNLGNSIISNNCTRFLVNKNSAEICTNKVNEHLLEIFDDGQIADIEHELSTSFNFSIIDFIRGHFLFSATLKFITVLSKEFTRKNMSMANDAFFTSMLIAFEKNLSCNDHLEYYQNKISNLS